MGLNGLHRKYNRVQRRSEHQRWHCVDVSLCVCKQVHGCVFSLSSFFLDCNTHLLFCLLYFLKPPAAEEVKEKEAEKHVAEAEKEGQYIITVLLLSPNRDTFFIYYFI